MRWLIENLQRCPELVIFLTLAIGFRGSLER
jgi:hypothetical protein